MNVLRELTTVLRYAQTLKEAISVPALVVIFLQMTVEDVMVRNNIIVNDFLVLI